MDGHAPGLPDKPLRDHALRIALEAAEAVLQRHDYTDVERSADVLFVALSEAYDETDADEIEAVP